MAGTDIPREAHYHVWRGREHPKNGYARVLERCGTFRTRSAAHKWLAFKGRRSAFGNYVLRCIDPYCKAKLPPKEEGNG